MNKVCVKGQRIYFYRRPEPIPKSQVNFSRIEFDMDETWSSFLSVVAQFIQKGEPKNVQVEDGYCLVPSGLDVGAFELCLRGDDGESVVASVNRLTFEVCEGFDPSGETPLPPSPDLYTQLIKEIDSGKKIAQSVRKDADAGLFNGERGADGGWYTPSVTQTDENTLRMDFTPSKGDMPDVAHTNIMLPDGGGGTSDHSKLSNRDAADQHPMSAITGLVDALAGKQPKGDYIPNPHTASVGQTIRVSAVDENGQPTEWEAVDMPSGGGGTTSDEWIDLGTLTLADGEEAINFSWKVNGQVKKIHIEGVYYSATSGKSLALFNSDGLSGPNPVITYSVFKFPPSAEKAMYMDLTVEELYPGYWFGVGGASIYNNPHENTLASYSYPKRVDSYLSLGEYWRNTTLTAGTWFNVKVVYY